MENLLYEFKRLVSRKQSVLILILFIAILLFDQYLLTMNSGFRYGEVIYHHATIYFSQQNDTGWTIFPIIMPLLIMGWFGFSFLEEKETTILEYSLTRMSAKQYIVHKLVTLSVLSFIFTFFLMALLFLIFLLRYPVDSSLLMSEQTPFYASQIFEVNTYIYSLLLILNTSFMSVFMTQAMILLTLFSKGKGALFAKGFLFLYIIPYAYQFAMLRRLPFEEFSVFTMATEYQRRVSFFMTPMLYWVILSVGVSIATIHIFIKKLKNEKLI
ncbi:MAG: hypothetical protein JJU16_00825 [Alkalibacterium sp.]|nr:hypothetical protein [Alkalibacterium sp.]